MLNLKVPETPIVVGYFETIPKGLEKKREEMGIKGRIKTIQSAVLLL